MFVKDWMSKNVVIIDPDDSMQHALSVMKEHKVRMLPVVSKGKLVGVVSDTDMKRASASDATLLDMHEALYLISKIKVKEIMSKDPVTVPPDFTVEETAEVLKEKKISGAPVMDDGGRLVGIITRDDLFNVLISVTGLGKRGVLFGFQVADQPGSIMKLTDIIRGHGGRIASILGCYEYAPPGYRIVYIRAYDLDREKLPVLERELKEQSDMLSMVDHRENRRVVFRDLA